MGDVIAFPRSPQTTPAESTGSRTATRRRLLWREAIGHELREERHSQDRTQGDVAEHAGISTQYLSEVERGRKEPSSEILEAVTDALRLPLGDLVLRAAELLPGADLVTTSSTDRGPGARPDGPVLLAA